MFLINLLIRSTEFTKKSNTKKLSKWHNLERQLLLSTRHSTIQCRDGFIVWAGSFVGLLVGRIRVHEGVTITSVQFLQLFDSV